MSSELPTDFRLPSGLKKPVTPMTELSFNSARVTAGSSKFTLPCLSCSTSEAGRASTSTFSPTPSAAFGLKPSELKTEAGAWAKLRKMHFDPNAPVAITLKPTTFGELAKDYVRVELGDDQTDAAIPKAHSTVATYQGYLNRHILPRWEMVRASEMEPVAIQKWLRDLHREAELSNPTLGEDSQCDGCYF